MLSDANTHLPCVTKQIIFGNKAVVVLRFQLKYLSYITPGSHYEVSQKQSIPLGQSPLTISPLTNYNRQRTEYRIC